MKRILAALALLCVLVAPSYAQKTKAALTSEINTNWPDNSSGAITPAILRLTVIDIINSYVDWLTCTGTGGIVFWSGGVPSCLAAGTNGQQLTLSGGIPAWGNLGDSLTAGAGLTITGTLTPTISITNVVTPTTVGAANAIPHIVYNAQGEITASSVLSPTVDVGSITSILSNSVAGNNTGSTANGTSLNGAKVGALLCLPNRQVLTTGTNTTYTTPTCLGALPTRIELEMAGGGGGGAGSGTTPGAAGSGTQTCWNTSGTACSTPLFSANGGSAGQAANGVNGAGGTTTSCDLGLNGGAGSGAANSTTGTGGGGGQSYFGGGAPTNSSNGAATAGTAGAANTGGGASGASAGGTAGAGGGGGAGGYCRKIITSPAASYVYTIGGAGAGGTLGTSGAAGGAGGTGLAIATAYWQ